MTVRIIEWQVPYTWGTAIEITPDKVINLLLRAENNLLHVNEDNELYCDLQLDSWIAPSDTFPVGVTTGIVNQSDGWSQNGLLLRYQTTSWAYAQWLYGADWNLYYDGWTWVWKQVLYSDQIMTILQDYIKWTDFHFVNKTWQTNITLSDMSTAISPTADFTINAPDPVEDGYVYLLRVSNWVSPYTMTLGTGISNPRNVDLTLTANGEDMFAFLAVWWILELQPEIDIDNEAYGASWDWITTKAPSKKAVYQKIESIEWEIDNVEQDVQDLKDYIDFEFWTTNGGSTCMLEHFSQRFIPNTDFDIEAWTVKEWMQYIVRIESWATAYTMSLWTWVTNPFGESLTLTASKTTTIVFLATSSSTLELFSIRTEV